jgi:hypothetical protein
MHAAGGCSAAIPSCMARSGRVRVGFVLAHAYVYDAAAAICFEGTGGGGGVRLKPALLALIDRPSQSCMQL